MNLPNYFLADLPPEAVRTPAMVTEACQTLKRNRAQYLASRTTENLIELLAEIGANWLRPDYALRGLALEHGPALLRFSRPTIEHGLDAFFSEITAENLRALLVQELGHAQRLDGMAATAAERAANRAACAQGPELLAHITAGNIPNPALMSILLGMLARSAQFVKCAQGASLLPRLFAHSIYEIDPKLASCLELAEWPGGSTDLEAALFAEAGCVTATGSDTTLDDVRRRLPVTTRFVGHGHRVSFGFITREALAGAGARRLARDAAGDVAAWDQQGCLSPHVIYVEEQGAVSPAQFAGLLAEELARCETDRPRGELLLSESTTITLKRDFYRVRSAATSESLETSVTQLWCSEGSTAWTVLYEDDARFQVSCLNRFVHVKRATDLEDVLHHAELIRGQVSTVGLAAAGDRARDLAAQLTRWGVSRVCPLGRMQRPPLGWRHDGRPPLADLVSWTDWEREEALC
jgi:hypothetical protein